MKSVLESAASKAALGLLRSDEMTRIAAEALGAGFDSPSLRVLAGLSTDSLEDAATLFSQAMTELSVPSPRSKGEAVITLSREIAEAIATGSIPPEQGAVRIWKLSLSATGEDLTDLHPFIYAASEWDDRTEDRPLFAEMIVRAAKDLVGPG